MATTQKAIQVTPERIMQFYFGYAPTLAINAAIQNRVFDVLDEGPKTIEEVSSATGASQRGLRSIMNLLAGLQFLTKDEKGSYGLSPDTAAFLVRDKPSYIGGVFAHSCRRILPKWLELDQIVHSGRPTRALNQKEEGAQFFGEFVEDLFPLNYQTAQAVVRALRLYEAKEPMRVLDLAAGSGVWGIAAAQASPRVQVTAVDWPEVIPVTQRMTKRFRLEDRFTFIKGDLRETYFGENYDVAFLGHILHCEGGEQSKRLLEKTGDSLKPGGKVVIAEWVVNDDRSGPLPVLIFGANMLVNTDEGDVFSFEEISNWLRDAGFENPRTIDAPGPSPLIVADKA